MNKFNDILKDKVEMDINALIKDTYQISTVTVSRDIPYVMYLNCKISWTWKFISKLFEIMAKYDLAFQIRKDSVIVIFEP